MKRTKGISTFIFGAMMGFLMFYCVYPPLTYANPPQDVKLAYDLNSQTLTVTITHYAPAQTRGHYVKSVEIWKNGIAVSTNTYDSQPGPAIFEYNYKVSAARGDTLKVTATCSRKGNKTATLEVGK